MNSFRASINDMSSAESASKTAATPILFKKFDNFACIADIETPFELAKDAMLCDDTETTIHFFAFPSAFSISE